MALVDSKDDIRDKLRWSTTRIFAVLVFLTALMAGLLRLVLN